MRDSRAIGRHGDLGARLGIISDHGRLAIDDVNRRCRRPVCRESFDPELVIYGRKDSTRNFEHAGAQAGTPERRPFVGKDVTERSDALRAGYLVVSHLLLALPVP